MHAGKVLQTDQLGATFMIKNIIIRNTLLKCTVYRETVLEIKFSQLIKLAITIHNNILDVISVSQDSDLFAPVQSLMLNAER